MHANITDLQLGYRYIRISKHGLLRTNYSSQRILHFKSHDDQNWQKINRLSLSDVFIDVADSAFRSGSHIRRIEMRL